MQYDFQFLATRKSDQLSAILDKFGAPTDLLGLATYFEILRSRSALLEALTELLEVRYGPGRVHAFLAGLPNAPLVLTTNYDRFIERAFDEVGRQYHLIVNIKADERVRTDRFCWYAPVIGVPEIVKRDHFLDPDYPIIFKLHGSLGLPADLPGSLVISEEDYFKSAGRQFLGTLLPTQIAAAASGRTSVFLGYGLGDIHVRHALLRSRNRHRHFAFNRTVSEFQKAFWRLLHVEAHELDCSQFAQRMAALLDHSTDLSVSCC